MCGYFRLHGWYCVIVIVLLFVLTGVCVLIWVLCVFFGIARASLMRCSAQLFSVRPLCVLEQPRVYNPKVGPTVSNWLKAGLFIFVLVWMCMIVLTWIMCFRLDIGTLWLSWFVCVVELLSIFHLLRILAIRIAHKLWHMHV